VDENPMHGGGGDLNKSSLLFNDLLTNKIESLYSIVIMSIPPHKFA